MSRTGYSGQAPIAGGFQQWHERMTVKICDYFNYLEKEVVPLLL
jgi:hypothetical protein